MTTVSSTVSAQRRYNRGTFTNHAHMVRKDGGWKMAKHMVRTVVPGSTVLLLSDASKMPSLSFSLPAGESCPWAKYGEGSICGACYAMKGRYVMPNVANAQRVRYAWVRACLKTAEGTDAFVSVMTRAIHDAGNTYFRGHDSGDFFCPAYVDAWTRICSALPEVTFWFPTRTWRVLTHKDASATLKARWALALTSLASLPNVRMRPSALFFNAPAPMVRNLIPGMAAGTTATDVGFTCPAPTTGNTCGTCRTCWDSPDTAVSYHRH
jgi:protein gp88